MLATNSTSNQTLEMQDGLQAKGGPPKSGCDPNNGFYYESCVSGCHSCNNTKTCNTCKPGFTMTEAGLCVCPSG